jgi:hypothetical protein
MSVSPIKLALERARQEAAQDANFFRKMTYFFELRVPQSIALGPINTFLTPLVLPPESYSMEEPFTIQVTPTQGGGLYVEENGIVQRTIKLEGTTGFRPRYFPTGWQANAVLSPEKTSHGRILPGLVAGSPLIPAELSGQRHFQYIQDAIFRTYGDLKRDPATSEGTFLFFHNPKDDEHWLVAPQKFSLTRTADKRVLYRYSIELLILDKAAAVDQDFSEETNILDDMKNALSAVNRGLGMITGAINDLTALVGELKNLVKGFATIIDTATSIITAARNFVDGVTSLIDAPYAILNSLNELCEAAGFAIEEQEEATPDIVKIPRTTRQHFRRIQDGVNWIGIHPEVFITSAIKKAQRLKNAQSLYTSASDEAIAEALETDPPSTLDAVTALGTEITQGEAIAAQNETQVAFATPQYTSTQETPITQGDTLASLAAKYLGDARLWQQIAIVNGLQPPYVTEMASIPLPTSAPPGSTVGGGTGDGTPTIGPDPGPAPGEPTTSVQQVSQPDESPFPASFGSGGQILMPSFRKPPQKTPLLPVLGVSQDESAAVHLLGADLQIGVASGTGSRREFDLVVDTERGGIDAKSVSGLANIGQACVLRLTIEKGTDIMYKKVGLDRVVALNITPVDLETVRFRFAEALTNDPRVASVPSLTFTVEEGASDLIVIDADVELRGFTQNTNIRALVGA